MRSEDELIRAGLRNTIRLVRETDDPRAIGALSILLKELNK